jgi:hypothetical protein
MATAYGLAIVLSARGLWRMAVFLRSDRGIAAATTNETLDAMWQGFAQVTGCGPWALVVLAAVFLGLGIIWRRSPNAALVLAATACATVAMIFAGRSVHHLIAPRYFTVMQPAVWIALAALPAMAIKLHLRVALAAALAALLAAQTWQATHIDRWVDLNTWRYARCAARFIHEARGPDDLFACTPYINFRVAARYYNLYRPADDELHRQMAQRSPLPPALAQRTIWLQGYMYHPQAEEDLRTLLYIARAGARTDANDERWIDGVKNSGLAIVRLSSNRADAWTYDAASDSFRPVSAVLAEGSTGVRATAR